MSFTAWSDSGVLQSPKQLMLCVRTGASQPTADVDAAEHEQRRFARRPEPRETRSENNARQQPCAFGHWCASRQLHGECKKWHSDCWPCRRRALRERIRLFDDTAPLDPGLLHPGLRSPVLDEFRTCFCTINFQHLSLAQTLNGGCTYK